MSRRLNVSWAIINLTFLVMNFVLVILYGHFINIVGMSAAALMGGTHAAIAAGLAGEEKRTALDRLHDRIRAREIEIYGGVVSGSLLREHDLTRVEHTTNSLVAKIQKELTPKLPPPVRPIIADETRRNRCVREGHRWFKAKYGLGDECVHCGYYRATVTETYETQRKKYEENLMKQYGGRAIADAVAETYEKQREWAPRYCSWAKMKTDAEGDLITTPQEHEWEYYKWRTAAGYQAMKRTCKLCGAVEHMGERPHLKDSLKDRWG